MKIRTDFVTNSSSSSFIVIKVKGTKIEEIINKYSEFIEGLGIELISDVEDGVDLICEEFCSGTPNSIDNFIDSLIELVDEDALYDFEDDEEMNSEEHPFASELKNNEKEIIDTIEKVEWNYGDSGWQGDSDVRYCKDKYSEEQLNEIYSIIAEEKGIDISEVDDDDFNEYVCDKISEEETVFIYDGKTKKSTFTNRFSLL